MFVLKCKSRLGTFTKLEILIVCIIHTNCVTNTAAISLRLRPSDYVSGSPSLYTMSKKTIIDDFVTDYKSENFNFFENDDVVVTLDENQVHEMPAAPGCSKSNNECENRSAAHIIVSTIDGSVTSFNLETGALEWSHNIGQMPLLSSSSRNLIMKSDGELVRLAPSLDGLLYKLDQNNILEPVPFETDTLLSSSINIAEDVSFTGKKSSAVLGISMANGSVIYHCGSKGCSLSGSYETFSDSESIIPFHCDRDILVLKKVIYDVLAFDLHEGNERFNLSFGQQHLQFFGSRRCKDEGLEVTTSSLPLPRFVIPAGTVFAENELGAVVWTEQLDSPINSAWELINGKLSKIDLLKPSHIPALTPHSSGSANNPDLYLGLFEGDLYIQHSDRMRNKINAYLKQIKEESVLDGTIERPSTQWNFFEGWRMMPASKQHKVLALEHQEEEIQKIFQDFPSDFHTSHSVHANNIGFFLFFNESNEHIPEAHKKCPKPVKVNEGSEAISYHYILSIFCSVILAYFLMKKERGIRIFSNFKMKARQFYSRFVGRQVVDDLDVNTDLEDVDTFLAPEVVKDTKIHKPPTIKEEVNEGQPPPTKGQQSPQATESKTSYEILYDLDLAYVNTLNDLNSPEKSGRILIQDVLGCGAFGLVFKAVRLFQKQQVAIKSIRCPKNMTHKEFQKIQKETVINSRMINTNVVQNFDALLMSHTQEWDEQFRIWWKERMEYKNMSHHGLFEISSTSASVTNSLISRESSDSVVSSNSDSISFEKSNNDEILFNNHRYIYFILELCQEKTLSDWIENENTGDKSVIHTYFLGMVKGLEYIHDKGYIHRDLKPSNILFGFDDGVVKIGDFGLGTLNSEVTDEEVPGTPAERQKTLGVGTVTYMCPEIKKSTLYDYKVDIYSLGIILFEMLTVTKTVSERIIKVSKIKEGNYPLGFEEEHPEEYQLIKEMIHTDPKKRPTTKGIRCKEPLRRLQHPSKLSNIHDNEHYQLVTKNRRDTATNE